MYIVPDWNVYGSTAAAIAMLARDSCLVRVLRAGHVVA